MAFSSTPTVVFHYGPAAFVMDCYEQSDAFSIRLTLDCAHQCDVEIVPVASGSTFYTGAVSPAAIWGREVLEGSYFIAAGQRKRLGR